MLSPLLAAAREEEGKCRCLAVNATRQHPFLIIIILFSVDAAIVILEKILGD
jgi:hypothetical protein